MHCTYTGLRTSPPRRTGIKIIIGFQVEANGVEVTTPGNDVDGVSPTGRRLYVSLCGSRPEQRLITSSVNTEDKNIKQGKTICCQISTKIKLI